MEQILSIIVVSLVGLALERWSKSKERKKARKTIGEVETEHRAIDTNQVPPIPTEQPALTSRPGLLNFDRDDNGMKQTAVPPAIPALHDEEKSVFEPMVDSADETADTEAENEAARWRRAIIDSEILARKF